MKNIDDIMTILHKEINHEKFNKLEEIVTTRYQHDDSLKEDRYFLEETSLAEDEFINTKALRGNDFKSILNGTTVIKQKM